MLQVFEPSLCQKTCYAYVYIINTVVLSYRYFVLCLANDISQKCPFVFFPWSFAQPCMSGYPLSFLSSSSVVGKSPSLRKLRLSLNTLCRSVTTSLAFLYGQRQFSESAVFTKSALCRTRFVSWVSFSRWCF